MNEPISHIWKLVLDGDTAAWKTLVSQYTGLVLTVARRVGLSRLDAEDCAQYTWIALYRNRRRIKDPRRLSGWLALTARRRAVELSKRQARYTDLGTSRNSDLDEVLPETELLALERQALLEQAMSRMDERCRKLLHALFLSPEDHSYKDIAEALKVSPNTLGPLRSRCLNKLRKILEETGYELD